jgi:autotransporter-associated beta strand protein
VINFSIPSNLCTIQGPMETFAGTINMGSSAGTLRLNGNVNATYGSPIAAFDLGTASAKLCNRNGDITIDFGSISGGINTTLQGRQSGSGTTSSSTYNIGGRNSDAVFSGHIDSGGDLSGLNLIKVGTGTWTLGGTSTYTGTLTAQQGRIILSGPLACSGSTQVLDGATFQLASTLTTEELIVAAGGQLTGSGTIAGDLTNNGTVNCTGPLIITGDTTNNGTMRLTSGATLVVNGALINTGLLDLLTANVSPSFLQNIINQGVILDSSLVKVTSASLSNGFTITIQGYSGHIYRLQRSTTLAGVWTDIGPSKSGIGTALSFNDPAAPGIAAFYRIAVSP